MEGTTEEEWAHKRMLRLLILAPEVTVEPDDESADQGMHWTEIREPDAQRQEDPHRHL